MKPLAVAVGGAAGALARWGIGLAFGKRALEGWPWATFLINISGCFAIGMLMMLANARGRLDPSVTLLLGTGFCGAYTTFSTFSWETQQMVTEGAWLRAALYVLLSNGMGFAAVLAGARLLAEAK